VIIGYGTGRGNGGGHEAERSIPVEYMKRSTKQAFTRCRVHILRRGKGAGVLHIWKQLIIAICHCCEARTEAVYEKHEQGKRSPDLNCWMCMKCIDNILKQQSRNSNAAIKFRLLPTSELVVPVYFKRNIRERKREHSQITHATAGAGDNAKRLKL
jgi:hypothetical protein